MNGLGHQREAVALLATAAPLDHPGFVRAHLAVAQSLLNSTNVSDAMVQMAGQHLLNALALDPQSPEINEMLGRFYINTHDLEKARSSLKQVYPFKNDVALLLAITYSAGRDESATKAWADAAIETFTKRLKNASPLDSQADRLGLVQALLIENNPAEALKILEEGIGINESPVYDAGVAEVCATWAAQMAARTNFDSAECLRLVQKGLRKSPQNLKLWLVLIQISHAADAAGAQARSMIKELMETAGGETAAGWHLLLATDARRFDQKEESRRHLQAAYQLAPDIPEVANDMAMDMAFGPQPDLGRALLIIQTVVERFPTSPNFRDTRGRILLELGRASEAMADLEFAAGKLPDSNEVQQALAAARKMLEQAR
jgi:tetratricopeptide (TPR) repeat protein